MGGVHGRLAGLDLRKATVAACVRLVEASRHVQEFGSTTDPHARMMRMMRMADDAIRPCCNIQLATACGFIVGLSPTNQSNAHSLAEGMVR